MKVLFLDIDGVLNHHDFLVANKAKIVEDWSGRAEIDTVAVARLRRVIEATGANVVLSSSWRHRFHGAEMRGFFAGYGILIMSVTPTIQVCRRGDEIAAWLRSTSETVDEYVVLDDYDDAGSGHEDRFVQTNYLVGLTDELADDAIRILGRRE